MWLREAGTLGGRARDGLGTAHIVGERGDARRIDPAFCYRVAVPVELLCTLIPVLLLGGGGSTTP